jgi:hypothetical protein
MRFCLLFRGDTIRYPEDTPYDTKRTYLDALMCWDNWKKTIVNDLIENGHTVEIVFITYQSTKLDEVIRTMSPNHVIVLPIRNKYENGKQSIQFLKDHINDYDRVLISRFDIMYRIKITQWPKWNETGFFVVNKDVHWPNDKHYSDILFMFDINIQILNDFRKALDYAQNDCPEHGVGKYLYINKIPFHVLFEDYYHILDHPLHCLGSRESVPDLDNPYEGIKVVDVSQYNQ